MFNKNDRIRFEDMQTDLTGSMRAQERLASRLYGVETRLDRYSKRLSAVIGDLQQCAAVINRNSQGSTLQNDALLDLRDSVSELAQAVDVLAKDLGKEIVVAEAVPAEITITPGLPERLVVKKLPRGRKQDALPAPITMSVEKFQELVDMNVDFEDENDVVASTDAIEIVKELDRQ